MILTWVWARVLVNQFRGIVSSKTLNPQRKVIYHDQSNKILRKIYNHIQGFRICHQKLMAAAD